MKASRKKVLPKRPGRPATGIDPVMTLRMAPELTAAIEKWAKAQADNPPRSEAMRRLVEIGLSHSLPRGRTSLKAATAAREMAGEQIDRHTDSSASPEEQQRRKRRLLKGPKEFRDLRQDDPTPTRKA